MVRAATDTKKPTGGKRRKRSLAITAGSCLDITIAHELHGKLCEALAAGQPLVINASQVERADTAALQMLCALFRDSDAGGGEVTWKQPSEVLCKSAQLLDMDVPLRLSVG